MADELPQNFSLAELIHANTQKSSQVHEAVVTDISQRKGQRRRDFWKFALLTVLLVLQVAFFAVYMVQESDRAERASEDRKAIQATLAYLEDCLSPKRTQSDCQKRTRGDLQGAYNVIEERSRDQLIVFGRCLTEPTNVDDQALEDCILAETELLRKQREQNQ